MIILERSDNSWHVDLNCTGWGHGGYGCNSLLRVSKNDLVYYPGSRDMTRKRIYPSVSFRCPVCNECTNLGTQDWPQHAKTLLNVTTAWYNIQDSNKDSGDKQPD